MSDWPPLARQDVMQFCRENSRATLLLMAATQDYAAARCLLLNHLMVGLQVGAQAMEKYLKAYVLLREPLRDVKKMSHSLSVLLAEAAKSLPDLSTKFSGLAAKFARHYNTRYPDNPDGSKSMTTADIIELDEFVVFLNENMPCPRNVRYRTGLYASITFSLDHGHVSHLENWITTDNRALASLLPSIKTTGAAVLKELYPAADPVSGR